jgi:hypothetical protein
MITSSCRQVLSSFFLLLFVIVVIFVVFVLVVVDELSLGGPSEQSRGQHRAGTVYSPVIQVRCWGYIQHSFPCSLFCAAHFGRLRGLMTFATVLQFTFTRSNLEPHHGRAL